MLRDILSSKMLIAGFVFFLLVVGGSLLYSWHVRRITDAELARTHAALQHLVNREGKTDTRTGQAAPTENEVPVKNAATADATIHTVWDDTKSSVDTPQEKPLEETSVSDIEADIIAEEEKAEEALSDEERRNKEGQKRFSEVWAEMETLIKNEGGRIDNSSPPGVRYKLALLQAELFDLMQEGSRENHPALNFFMGLALRMHSSVDINGEMPVSEYLKLADYMAAEGDVEISNAMYAVAQYAIENGDDVIKREHIEDFE